MARPFPILSTSSIHIIPSINIIFAVLSTLSIFSLVTFLCASHGRQKEVVLTRKKLTISRKNLLESLSKANSISSKALLKMVSWRKQVQHEEDDEHDYYDNNHNKNHDYFAVNDDGFIEEGAVWKKTIIKGEKCKPLDFSGKIEYDSEGNLLPDKSVVCEKNEIISSNNKQVVVS